jgi:hypothetical protein
MNTSSTNNSSASGCLDFLIWNRFSVKMNARIVFTKALWLDAGRERTVTEFVAFASSKGIAVDSADLNHLWDTLERELASVPVALGGAA